MKIYPFDFSNPMTVDCDWEIFYYHDVLDTQVLAQLRQEHQAIRWEDFEIKDEDDLESSWNFIDNDHVLHEYFSNPELISFIERTASCDLSDCKLKINYKYDGPHHTLQEPHRDSGFSKLTFQIFLQEEDYPDGGTILHSGKEKQTELPMLSNSGGFFSNTLDSWHSVKQRGYHRKSVLVRYLLDN
jgi:hypothetical protein